MKAIDRAYALAERLIKDMRKASNDIVMTRLERIFFDQFYCEINGYMEEMDELYLEGDENALYELCYEIRDKLKLINKLIDVNSKLNFKFG
jgi:hypothetical protein